jgi:hypothetical protein
MRSPPCTGRYIFKSAALRKQASGSVKFRESCGGYLPNPSEMRRQWDSGMMQRPRGVVPCRMRDEDELYFFVRARRIGFRPLGARIARLTQLTGNSKRVRSSFDLDGNTNSRGPCLGAGTLENWLNVLLLHRKSGASEMQIFDLSMLQLLCYPRHVLFGG